MLRPWEAFQSSALIRPALTTGKMRVREVWGENHYAVLEAAASCCDAELDANDASGSGDPTEIAILVAARERGILKESVERDNPRVSAEPFDPDRKRMSVLRRNGTLYVKGAFESVRAICSSGAGESADRAVKDMSERGLRVLAVATGTGAGERDLAFLGIVGLADPPRTEALQAIAECRAADHPVMITGDHPATARAIARELGLVLEESPDDRVHARATPEETSAREALEVEGRHRGDDR